MRVWRILVIISAVIFIIAANKNVYAGPCELAESILANAYETLGDNEKVNVAVMKAQEICPENGWGNSFEARLWAMSGDCVRARNALQAGLDKSPNEPAVWRDAIRVYRICGDYGKAKKFADSLASHFPDDSEVMLDVGVTRYENGQKTDGISTLSSCAENDEKLGHCDFQLGRIYLKSGNKKMAELHFNAATEKNSVAYTSYAVQREYENISVKRFVIIVAILTLLVAAGIAGYFYYKKNAAKKREKEMMEKLKAEGYGVEVSISVLNAPKGTASLEITSERVTIGASSKHNCYVCMFAITALEGIVPLNAGNDVEVFGLLGESIEQGTLFLKMKGQTAHCFVVGSKAKFDFKQHVLPYIKEVLDAPITEEEPKRLPLPVNYFGQAYLRVKR